jgi:hypothetical protein
MCWTSGRVVKLGLVLSCLLSTTGRAGAQTPAPGASPPPTAAQASSPPTSVTSLTVVAPKSGEPSYTQALDFIQSHGAPARSGQLARWRDPVCPITMGLSPQVDAWVSRWIVARAARVGAAIPKRGGCRPNIEIVFTSDPQGVLDFVAKKRDAYLGYHYVAQTKAFSTVTRPVEARYLTATRSVAGGESFDIASGSSPSASSFVGDGSLDIAGGSSPSGCAGSSFTRCISSHFVNVLIVVDGKALNGRKVAPVADYIAMLALSQARSLEGCGALPSILDLLSSKCGDRSAPDAWTGGDTAYLRGLYSANLEDVMWLEKDTIADRMVKNLAPTTAASK